MSSTATFLNPAPQTNYTSFFLERVGFYYFTGRSLEQDIIIGLNEKLLSLSLMVSCNPDKSSKDESCSSNGAQVACSELRSPSRENVLLVATVKPAIPMTDYQVEILENVESIIEQSRNGNNMTCSINIPMGAILKYRIDGNKLELRTEGEVLLLTRVGETSNSLIGRWEFQENEENGRTVTSFEFSEREMTMTHSCYFNI